MAEPGGQLQNWVAFTDRGLALKMSGPFRPFHPPLLIPWASIHRLRERRFFGMPVGAVVELSTPKLDISLPPELMAELENRLNDRDRTPARRSAS
ncbi:MAG: hypothetical protein HY319_06780 [Armatimonadetes bacterium]|nr:hypothetical protein [Armatimonadota bacterium]